MSESKSVTVNLGGFSTLLTILFIGLKLGHVIDWSWWWVLSPFLFSCGLGLLMMAFVLTVGILVYWHNSK